MKWFEAATLGGANRYSDIKEDERNFAAEVALKDIDTANDLKKSLQTNQEDYGGNILFNYSDDDDYSHLGNVGKRIKRLGEFRDNFKKNFFKNGEFQTEKYNTWKAANPDGHTNLRDHWSDAIGKFFQPDAAQLSTGKYVYRDTNYDYLKEIPELYDIAESKNPLKQSEKFSTIKSVTTDVDGKPQKKLISEYYDINPDKIKEIDAADFIGDTDAPINLEDEAYTTQVIEDMMPMFLDTQYGGGDGVNFYNGDETIYKNDMKANPWKALIANQIFLMDYERTHKISKEKGFKQIAEIAINHNLSPDHIKDVFFIMAKKYNIEPIGNSEEYELKLPMIADKTQLNKAQYAVDASNKVVSNVDELLNLYELAPRTGFASYAKKRWTGLFGKGGQVAQLTTMISQIENDDIADENQKMITGHLKDALDKFKNVNPGDDNGVADAMKTYYQVTLAFNQALTVQGGSGGGKSVSDSDYSRVYGSLNFGNWENLDAVLGTLHKLKNDTIEQKLINEIYVDERYQKYHKQMVPWFRDYWKNLEGTIEEYTNALQGVEYWGENYVIDEETKNLIPQDEYTAADGNKTPIVAIPSRMMYLKRMFVGEQYPDVNPSTPELESIWSSIPDKEKLAIRGDEGHKNHFLNHFGLNRLNVSLSTNVDDNNDNQLVTSSGNSVDEIDVNAENNTSNSHNPYRLQKNWTADEKYLESLEKKHKDVKLNLINTFKTLNLFSGFSEADKSFHMENTLKSPKGMDKLITHRLKNLKPEDLQPIKDMALDYKYLTEAIQKGAYKVNMKMMSQKVDIPNLNAKGKTRTGVAGTKPYVDWMEDFGDTHDIKTGLPLFTDLKGNEQ